MIDSTRNGDNAATGGICNMASACAAKSHEGLKTQVLVIRIGLIHPLKFPILYTLKRSNSNSILSVFNNNKIFFWKIPISAIQKSKEIWGLTGILFCDWTQED